MPTQTAEKASCSIVVIVTLAMAPAVDTWCPSHTYSTLMPKILLWRDLHFLKLTKISKLWRCPLELKRDPWELWSLKTP